MSYLPWLLWIDPLTENTQQYTFNWIRRLISHYGPFGVELERAVVGYGLRAWRRHAGVIHPERAQRLQLTGNRDKIAVEILQSVIKGRGRAIRMGYGPCMSRTGINVIGNTLRAAGKRCVNEVTHFILP